MAGSGLALGGFPEIIEVGALQMLSNDRESPEICISFLMLSQRRLQASFLICNLPINTCKYGIYEDLWMGGNRL